MIRQGVLAVGLMLAAALPIAAQTPEEGQDGQACKDDAFKLCDRVIRDRDRLIACLVYNRQVLSASCRQALASYLPSETKDAAGQSKGAVDPKSKGAANAPLSLSPDLR
jgi:hypothetical protein